MHTQNQKSFFRNPEVPDAVCIWNIVKSSQTLDLNSKYFYLMFCSEFKNTSIVFIDENTEIAGFICGLLPPNRSDTLFVWQIAVKNEWKGKGIGKLMIKSLLERLSPYNINYLEASYTPSNVASKSLFRSVSRDLNIDFSEKTYFGSDSFGQGEHEEEILIRIGPIN